MLKPLIWERVNVIKGNWEETNMNSWKSGWLQIKCSKWPPPTARHIRTQRCMLYTVHRGTSFSVWVVFIRMSSFKVSMVRSFFPVHSLLQVGPNIVTLRCQVWRPMGSQILWYDSVLQCSQDLHVENESHSAPTVEAAATYSGTVPSWTAMFPKQVPSASDHSFKNYRQKRPGRSVWITLLRGSSYHHIPTCDYY
jgi:hypothetical protein